MPKKSKKPRLVTVTWVDAVGYEEVHGTLGHILDKAKLWVRETAGYLLHQDGDDISPMLRRTVLSHDYDKAMDPGVEDEYGNITVLPTGWVLNIREVRNGGKSKAKKGGDQGGGGSPGVGVGAAASGDGESGVAPSARPSGVVTGTPR